MKTMPAALAAIIITTGVAAQDSRTTATDAQQTGDAEERVILRVAPPPAPPAPPPPPSAQSIPDSMAADMPEGANVIIYRLYAEPTVWAATVKVDGKKLAALGNKKWTAVRLEPGTYTIKTSWSFMSGQRGGEYELVVEEGRTHFLEITGTSQWAGGFGSQVQFRMGSGIGEVRGNGAYRRVEACCTFKEPKF